MAQTRASSPCLPDQKIGWVLRPWPRCCLSWEKWGGFWRKLTVSPLGSCRFTERSQPPARILRPCRMFWSPATPPLPSSPVGRIGHHLLCNIFSPGLGDPSQPSWGRHWGPAVAASRPVWLRLAHSNTPLAVPLKHLSFGGPDFAGPAVSSAPVSLPVTAGGLSPKKPIASPPAATDVLPPMPGQGVHIASSLQGGGRGFAKCCQCPGSWLTAVMLLSPPLCPVLLPQEPQPWQG